MNFLIDFKNSSDAFDGTPIRHRFGSQSAIILSKSSNIFLLFSTTGKALEWPVIVSDIQTPIFLVP